LSVSLGISPTLTDFILVCVHGIILRPYVSFSYALLNFCY
jgi:hypothetical protein